MLDWQNLYILTDRFYDAVLTSCGRHIPNKILNLSMRRAITIIYNQPTVYAEYQMPVGLRS